jgi:hypothetical protein
MPLRGGAQPIVRNRADRVCADFELLVLVIAADLWFGTTTTVGPHTVRCRQAIARHPQ